MRRGALVGILVATLACVSVSALVVLASPIAVRGWNVISGGGGLRSSSGQRLADTIGQTAIGSSQGTRYQIQPGFWFANPEVEYTLTIQILGSGTTTPEAGAHRYSAEENVRITASPEPGWYFSHWGADATGPANPVDVLMSANKIVTANFAAQGITLIGAIVQNPFTYAGQTVTLSGEYRGWETGHGSAPVSKSDWVIADFTGSMYVTGGSTNLRYPTDLGRPATASGIVRIKDDVPYLEVPRSGRR